MQVSKVGRGDLEKRPRHTMERQTTEDGLNTIQLMRLIRDVYGKTTIEELFRGIELQQNRPITNRTKNC